MKTEINALAQIHLAQDEIANALDTPNLSENQIRQLQKASSALRTMERNIVNKLGEDLIAALTTDSNALNELSEQIKQASNDLEDVAGKIGKIATLADALISIIYTAASVGI